MRRSVLMFVGTMVLSPIAGVACDASRSVPSEELGTQQSALGPPTSCFSYCEAQAPSGCWCDSGCTRYGDCCSDYVPQCVGGGSCANNCTSGPASGASCYCDALCSGFGDCCADYTAVCPDCGVTTRTWRASVVLEPSPGYFPGGTPATDPQVGVAANGDAVAIWKHAMATPPFSLSVRTRRYSGAGWTAMTSLGSDVSAPPRVEVGSSGDAFATFGLQEWSYRPSAGWTDAALASTPVAAAVDGSGNKLLLFRTGTNLDARRLTVGGVLEPSRRLSWNATEFDVASNTAGDFAAVYNIGPMLVLGVKYPGVDWGGTDFAPSGSSPRIGIDASRNLVVVWIDGRSIKALRVLGTTVGTTTTLASYAESVSQLKLAISSTGQAVAIWKRDFPSATNQRIVAAVLDASGAWSAPTTVADITYSPETPFGRVGVHDVGLDDCGAAQLVYETSPYAAFAARYTPASGWMAPTRLAGGALRAPRMATAANGITTVLWDGERGDVHAVRFE